MYVAVRYKLLVQGCSKVEGFEVDWLLRLGLRLRLSERLDNVC
jgi:hypothetical protein